MTMPQSITYTDFERSMGEEGVEKFSNLGVRNPHLKARACKTTAPGYVGGGLLK